MKRTIIASNLGASLLFQSGNIGYSQDFNKGLEAAQKGDVATAFREWSVLAERGFADAQLFLGVMYARCDGVLKDDKIAVQWYLKSADRDNAKAQQNLGVMYNKGWGVPQNYREAAAWYKKSAPQVNVDAKTNLGAMNGSGRGFSKIFSKHTCGLQSQHQMELELPRKTKAFPKKI